MSRQIPIAAPSVDMDLITLSASVRSPAASASEA